MQVSSIPGYQIRERPTKGKGFSFQGRGEKAGTEKGLLATRQKTGRTM